MEVGIAVEVRHFLILKRVAYMHFLKFTQVCTEICIILTWYKEYTRLSRELNSQWEPSIRLSKSDEFGREFVK